MQMQWWVFAAFGQTYILYVYFHMVKCCVSKWSLIVLFIVTYSCTMHWTCADASIPRNHPWNHINLRINYTTVTKTVIRFYKIYIQPRTRTCVRCVQERNEWSHQNLIYFHRQTKTKPRRSNACVCINLGIGLDLGRYYRCAYGDMGAWSRCFFSSLIKCDLHKCLCWEIMFSDVDEYVNVWYAY